MKSERHTAKISTRATSGDVLHTPRLISSRVDKLESTMENKSQPDHKLHISMDLESYAMLKWIGAIILAASDTEVIRRALKAYELFEPEDMPVSPPQRPILKRSDSTSSNVQHLYVRLPSRTMELLNRNVEETGLSYAEQIRHALRVFAQLVRTMEKRIVLNKKQAAVYKQTSTKGTRKSGVALLKMAAAL